MECVYAVLETKQSGDEIENYLNIFKELSSAREHFNELKDEIIEDASSNSGVDSDVISDEEFVENESCYLDIDGYEIIYIDKDEGYQKIIKLETHNIGE